MVTLPFSVPNFGFSGCPFVVRTMSTTGVPCRQIVTGSPSSTALINFGRVFLASATLTFMPSMIAICDGYIKPAGVFRQTRDRYLGPPATLLIVSRSQRAHLSRLSEDDSGGLQDPGQQASHRRTVKRGHRRVSRRGRQPAVFPVRQTARD